MNNNNNIEEFQALPLKYAYGFLNPKGFEKEIESIRNSKDKFKNYHGSTFRRAKILKLLNDNNLLEEFINIYWKFALSEEGKKKIKYYTRIMNEYSGNSIPESDEDIESLEETKFAVEEDLKKYLVKNLSVIEKGLELYKTDEEMHGIEFAVDDDNKRIDILAIDKNKIPVVIELKVSKGYERVIGQCLYYKNQIKRTFNVPKVRIIIIAREISDKLNIAVSELPDVELFSYHLSFKLDKIKTL